MNLRFREAALAALAPGDVVWVHDYQLLLLPKMLRERALDVQIGFFLHIPFPSFEVFRYLPTRWRHALLDGMLGADLIGFQTHDYTQYFLRSVFRTLGFEHHFGEITIGADVRRAEAFPIGIDYELVALYSIAPIALITPLRDGMNLVAKEYLANKPNGMGVLVLSEMAGAARELGEAVLINPNHRKEIAEALHEAVQMSPEEQPRRNRPMQDRLRSYDDERWVTNFLGSLSRVKGRQGKLATHHLAGALRDSFLAAYRGARRRLILLDYDGTLVPFHSQPHRAAPDASLLLLLERLTYNERNHVFIISGRDRKTLDEWFAGLPIRIIAEHGAWLRSSTSSWKLLKPLASKWKRHLAPLIQLYVDRVPGSLLEEKDYSLAWHYRTAAPELGQLRAKELVDELVGYTGNFDVQVLEGKKVVEVRNSGINKGAAAVGCVASVEPDLIFAVGDDQTDEDLFRALPKTAFTVRVGIPHSHATYHLDDHVDVRGLLSALAEDTEPGEG